MFGAVGVVRPIAQRGYSTVESLERSQQIAEIHVIGKIIGRQHGPDTTEILGQRPVRRYVARQRLPGMAMGVDETGQHDHAARV